MIQAFNMKFLNQLIAPESELVAKHLDMMEQMVAIDSRSLGINEFPGDRETLPDMIEILDLTSNYLNDIGFENIKVNEPPKEMAGATPILMAEIFSSADKPTILMYAHLDKQPYMDDGNFKQWGGVSPTRLLWNEDRSRAQGRGAADDLSGVIAIGMAAEAMIKMSGGNPGKIDEQTRKKLPCNLKVIFETEEESGSISLIDQILQNKSFFDDCDCVIITDVLNPDTGVPGLTTSLRGIVQICVTTEKKDPSSKLCEQTAMYKLLATLITSDHSLNVKGIAEKDIPVSPEEREGYSRVPTTLAKQREAGGLLSKTRLTVPETAVDIIQNQLRKSYANVRPGHRVAGGVLFGSAGARISFPLKQGSDVKALAEALKKHLEEHNSYQLKISLDPVETSSRNAVFDVIFKSSDKAPHSGVVGGPMPVPELLLARWIDQLILNNGQIAPENIEKFTNPDQIIEVQSLHVESDGQRWTFDNPSAKALVEIRLAPGNTEDSGRKALTEHLQEQVPTGFSLNLDQDKGGSPWITSIDSPVFNKMLDSLSEGFGKPSCLYGCGGSIPFVAKLMDALGDIAPLCIGAYDPACRMHEPGESLSMVDLLGCTRSMVHFFWKIQEETPSNIQNR
ncbi:MAG: M20/M25/M40 family metallo-hydrolase [Candidatus Nitronauta litoralis]|uniref:M20/M25/M40 family metallo-hydrolase n=1 Tax=Candidatus Nitronauta litoralis TaxID=2705533 RepID=A0A7T0FZ07_9BACT|nr:MAG: M20/M25/M40 family metallo-hydrolase [Candidatus Nitronauta litoralis]